jgi:PAS domain S-box-containing protein
VKSVLCIARDITERKQRQHALERNLALMRLLESLARAANEAVTPQAAMAACVELICRHGNWDLGRVALFKSGRPGGAPPLSVWHAPERERFDEFIRATNCRSHDSRPGVFISRVLRDRQPVWVEDVQQAANFGRLALAVRHGIRAAFAFPIIVQNSVVALIEILGTQPRPRDPLMLEAAQTMASQLARVIERARAQQSNARLAAIVESSQDAIISLTPQGRVLTWNAGAEKLFGYAAAEIVGDSITRIIPPGLWQEVIDKQALLGQGATVQSFEAVRVARNGRRIHVLHSMSPILDANGEMYAVSSIMRDITQRKQIEEELLAQAIRQRDTLVREVHHRIKNNLQGVIGLLRQKVRKYPALALEIEEAILQLQSVSTVYGLEHSHLGVLLPLAGIVDGICSATESITGCRVTKSYASDSPQPARIANSEAVAVAINELVFNAIKHGNKTDTGNGVEVLLREAAGSAEIRIINHGELPPQFDLADDRSLGSGLELVKALLSQPGSDLEVDSTGQEVKVVLKLAAPLLVGPAAAAV